MQEQLKGNDNNHITNDKEISIYVLERKNNNINNDKERDRICLTVECTYQYRHMRDYHSCKIIATRTH